MTRWFYVGGVTRIVVLRINWSSARKTRRCQKTMENDRRQDHILKYIKDDG